MLKFFEFAPLRRDIHVDKSLPRLREHEFKYVNYQQNTNKQSFFNFVKNKYMHLISTPGGGCSLAALPHGHRGVESSVFELTLWIGGMHNKSEL